MFHTPRAKAPAEAWRRSPLPSNFLPTRSHIPPRQHPTPAISTAPRTIPHPRHRQRFESDPDPDSTMGNTRDPRHTSDPRTTYNTVRGVNGPLVILENVRPVASRCVVAVLTPRPGQVSSVQRDCRAGAARWLCEAGPGPGNPRFAIPFLFPDRPLLPFLRCADSCVQATEPSSRYYRRTTRPGTAIDGL